MKEDQYYANFAKHTGMLIMWQMSSRTYQGTYAQIEKAYRAAQLHCLMFGWWSVLSLVFFNWFTLIRNYRTFNKIKKLHES